jgi:hypothetical protein
VSGVGSIIRLRALEIPGADGVGRGAGAAVFGDGARTG